MIPWEYLGKALIEKSHSETILLTSLGEKGIGASTLFFCMDTDLIFILESKEHSKKTEGKPEDDERQRKLESNQWQ